MGHKKLTLEVVTPDRLVLREDVDFIQLPGLDGYLGILPGHAPLLTELGKGVLSYDTGGERRHATALGGFAEILGDRVIVLAERAELAEEIDLGRAEAARERALKRLQEKAGVVNFARAQLSLERSVTRIRVAPRAAMRHKPTPLERKRSMRPPDESKS